MRQCEVRGKIKFKNKFQKHASNIKKYASLLSGEIVLGHSVRLTQAGQISKLEGYDIGDWWVQDAAAAIPVRLLGAARGDLPVEVLAPAGSSSGRSPGGGAGASRMFLVTYMSIVTY